MINLSTLKNYSIALAKQPKTPAFDFNNLNAGINQQLEASLTKPNLKKLELLSGSSKNSIAQFMQNISQSNVNKIDELVSTITESILSKVKDSFDQTINRLSINNQFNEGVCGCCEHKPTGSKENTALSGINPEVEQVQPQGQSSTVSDIVSSNQPQVQTGENAQVTNEILDNVSNILTGFFLGKDIFKSIFKSLKNLLAKPASLLKNIFKGSSVVSTVGNFLKALL